MNHKIKILGVLIIIVLIIIIISLGSKQIKSQEAKVNPIKIGVLTDLSGPAAYWGESTRAGAELAQRELRAQGYSVELIFEDYQLDPNQALTAAQKLVDLDGVAGIYSEFNPAAITVGEFTKEKGLPHIYVAAPVSPLEDAQNNYKSYLDYQAGCQNLAQNFKNQGIEKIGMLKINLEAGEVCLAGINQVYDQVATETYNLGDTDFKTPVLKMKNQQVEAVINVGFEGDILNTLKAIQENNYQVLLGTVDDTISETVIAKYPEQLKNTIAFGFAKIDPGFSQKLKENFPNKKLQSEYAAGFAYTHIKQIVKALAECSDNRDCLQNKLNQAGADDTIGFLGFSNRIAEIEMEIKEY